MLLIVGEPSHTARRGCHAPGLSSVIYCLFSTFIIIIIIYLNFPLFIFYFYFFRIFSLDEGPRISGLHFCSPFYRLIYPVDSYLLVSLRCDCSMLSSIHRGLSLCFNDAQCDAPSNTLRVLASLHPGSTDIR